MTKYQFSKTKMNKAIAKVIIRNAKQALAGPLSFEDRMEILVNAEEAQKFLDELTERRPAWGTQEWAETRGDDIGESPDF